MLQIQTLDFNQNDFWQKLDIKIKLDTNTDNNINNTVTDILHEVKNRGDEAIIEYSNKFDKRNIKNINEIIIEKSILEQSFNSISNEHKQALEFAHQRILNYHLQQKNTLHSWQFYDEFNNLLGQRITALDSVGIYVPGGKAAYPSSVLMNAIPAQLAGVANIIMVCPAPNSELNTLVLAAAYLSGINKIFTIGGAQAIAALTYGTKTIPAVCKIVGPGNAYVACAKKQVFGIVGIDMIAGPSEILVIAENNINPDIVAADLFSQAEHDELAQSILISNDKNYIQQVLCSMEKILPTLPRHEIIKQSLNNRGLLIYAENIEDICNITNYIAPEHLEILSDNAEKYLNNIKNAGAIFIGKYSSEALGDYCAGANHVLPTSGNAKFSSPLGIYDFQKRSSIINISQQGAQILGKHSATLAKAEGLDAHALSALSRIL